MDYFEEISNRLADIEFLSLEKDELTNSEKWELKIATESYYACPYVRMGKRLDRLYAEMLIGNAVKRKKLEALNGIKFDHEQGQVTIGGITIKAPVIQYGGGAGASGTTNISNTSSESAGTSIKVTGNANMGLTGDAKITQN